MTESRVPGLEMAQQAGHGQLPMPARMPALVWAVSLLPAVGVGLIVAVFALDTGLRDASPGLWALSVGLLGFAGAAATGVAAASIAARRFQVRTLPEAAQHWLMRTNDMSDRYPNPAMRIAGSGTVEQANPAARALLAGIAMDAEAARRWNEICAALRDPSCTERKFETNGRSYLVRRLVPFEADALNLYALDVTELLAKERQLAESESRLALATRTARLGLFEVNVVDRTIGYNDIYAWQVGLGPSARVEALDAWAGRLHPVERGLVVAAMEDFLAGRAGHYRIEHRLNDGRGHWLWVSAIAEVVEIDASGLPRRIIGSHLDVTELKRSEFELERLNRRRTAQLDLVALSDRGSESALMEGAARHGARLTESSSASLQLARPDGSSDTSGEYGASAGPAERSCVTVIRENGGVVARFSVAGKQTEYDHEDELTLQAVGSEAWRLVQRIRQSQKLEIQSRVLESAVNGIVIADASGRLEWANPAFERIIGYTLEEIVGRNLRFLRSGEHDEAFYRRLWDTISSGRTFAAEFVNRRKDGTSITVGQTISPVTGVDGRIDKYISICEDITERKSAEHRLSFLAQHDELTGLLNRASLVAAIEQAISESDRTGRSFAVIYIGLDYFKVVNDRFGRRAGDEMLRRVGQTLSGCMRPTDAVARTGGDEFAILQRMARGPDDAAVLARRLSKSLVAASEAAAVPEMPLSASIGISVFPSDQGNADELLMNAELAMRRAKSEGRGGMRYFTPALHEAALTKATLAAALPAAIRERQISLVYQPIVDLKTGRTVGCEALARWQHPELGRVPPDRFIAIAEETGLIRDLGLYILDRAIGEFAAAVPDMREMGITLSVNLSFGQFAEDEFMETIREELARTGFPAGHLEFELTESMLAVEPERAIEITRSLAELGCKLAIDDFGTGYSSLALLRRFRVDYLKIDRSFIIDLEGGAAPQAVVRAAIAMAHSLGIAIIAEGVELPEQAEFLRGEGADLVQGYLFGKPMPIDELAARLRAQPGPGENPPQDPSLPPSALPPHTTAERRRNLH